MALYIHVPFCKTKCPYCDFNTYQGIERMMDPYMGAVTQEITQWGRVLDGAAVNSVFFGGGTPSLSWKEQRADSNMRSMEPSLR